MGEDTTGMAESTAKLRQEIMALSGVDIMLDKNNFKSTYQIMDELSQKWESLSDISQATIIELMAGKHQGNVFASLMSNFDTARSALETSLNSSGSAMREHEKWQESLEARLNSLKASWQSLSQSFLDSDFLKNIISLVTSLVDAIDWLINRFGVLGTAVGVFKSFNILKTLIPSIISAFKEFGTSLVGCIKYAETFGDKMKGVGNLTVRAGKDIGKAFATVAKEIAAMIAIMNTIKAVQDIFSWLFGSDDDAENLAEEFDNLSSELSDATSKLGSLESELSNVESQIDALLAKDELSLTDEDELKRLKRVSSELERQIELTETLEESLQKSLNVTAINAYADYAKNTSFYSDKTKQERREEAEETGSSIGNIVGLVLGGIIGAFAGGNVVAGATIGAAIGSVPGSLGGSAIGGAIADSQYASEMTVREVLDNLHFERLKLENAEKEAYEKYTENPTDDNKEAWENAAVALNDYNAALFEHISQLSNYYNSIDYESLTTDEQRENYLQMGDDIDKYNIEMGVKGAKTTALDRYFDDELITDEAKELRAAIESALNIDEDVHFDDLNIDSIIEANGRLKDMGVTTEDVISYFKDLREAQAEALNYETYDMISNIAALSDGVILLKDAFAEFSEQGIVSAKTLVSLHETFGDLGEDWTNYVDVMTSGVFSMEEAREATEKLAEAHIGDLGASGGLKFGRLIEGTTDEYEFDAKNYKTYLSTINELSNLGVENAKAYVDAAQQEAMAREAVNRFNKEAEEIASLKSQQSKDGLDADQTVRLSELETRNKDIAKYISEIEKEFGVRLKNQDVVYKLKDLKEYKANAEKSTKYLNDLETYMGRLRSSVKAGMPDFPTNIPKGDMQALKNSGWYDAVKEKENLEREYHDKIIEIAKEVGVDLTDIDFTKLDDFGLEIWDISAHELVADKIRSQLEEEDWQQLADDLEAEINAELDNLGLEIDFGRSFNKITIDGINSKIEQIQTAISESISGSGLSTDSIIAIEDVFGGLDGYDASALFERTANGIRLNRQEFSKLNNEFKKSNVDELESKMSYLEGRYQKTKDELRNLEVGTDAYNTKIRDLSAIESQITATEELISQYSGLFSAYQNWQRMEASGQERDMYESIIGGFEHIDDEISRGWMDDGTIEFLELLTGRDLSTAGIEAQKKAYSDLNKEIGNAGYSIRDFFTVDDDGNSTNTGVYNFLETLESLEDEIGDVIKRENGKIVGFNFKVAGGNEAIAEALGISEELVEIMLRAADDAGFVVDVDGAVVQISYLKEQAEKAVENLTLLQSSGTEAAKVLEGVNVSFNLDADEGDLMQQYSAAIELLDKFKKDGKIDFSVEGAQDALDIAKFLTIQIDNLTEPRYMQIDMSTVEADLRKPIQEMQYFEELSNQKHLLELSGDTEGLENVNARMEEVTKGLEELDDDVKLKLGIDTDWTHEQIAEALERGEIEIPAQVEIGIQMSEDLKDMRLLMMHEAGLISYGEMELKIKYDIDDTSANKILEHEEEFRALTEEEKQVVVDIVTDENAIEALEGHQIEIEAFAKVFGVETVDDLAARLEGLDDEQIQVLAQVIGKIDVDKLKSAIDDLDDEEVQAIAEAIGQGDVEALKTAIFTLDDKDVQAIAKAFGYEDIESLKTAIGNLTDKDVQAIAQTLGITDVDSLKAAIDRLDDKSVEAIANVSGEDDVNNLQSAIKNLTGKSVTVWATIKQKASSLWSKITGSGSEEGGSGLNGTAHVNGTYGRAFKQGDWRTKKTENALVGELGREIVVTPDNRWHTVGDNGAEFANIPRGSIIFNHKQTEELLSNGKVSSGGGRGKAYASGTAHAYAAVGYGATLGMDKVSGHAMGTIAENVEDIANELGAEGNGGDGDKADGSAVGDNNKKNGSSSAQKDFEESFDWIEVAISRIERAIDNLDQKANNIYKSWSDRNSALTKEIGEVGKEIELQEDAAVRYLQEADSVGLSSDWVEKVRNGKIDINTVKDENLAEKIGQYQDWYEKHLKCIDAAEELRETEAKLYAQRVENVETQYEGILAVIEHEKNILDEYIAQSEANAQLISVNYYNALATNERENLAKLEEEKSKMLAEMQVAMDSGTITKYSEAWYDLCGKVDDVTLAIAESNTQLLEYEQNIQQLSWESFDLLQEKIGAVTEETEFLIELMSSDKLYDDKGQLTESGMATMGQHGVAYNTHMYQAELASAEAERLKKELAKDPFDTELEERYREMISLQQEHILAAQGEKEAIRDMVEEGIELELNALEEKINLYQESLDSQKD